jgi:hypothetical protein
VFLDYLRENGADEKQIQKVLRKKDWGKYDGMTYEEVKRHEVYVLKQWFKQEEKS